MKLNKEMLRQICELIQAHPQHFDMGHWASGCGTTGCISGWAMLIDRFETNPSYFRQLENLICGNGECAIKDAAKEGRRLLGMCRKDGEHMFYVGNWPQPFQCDYNNAECDDDHAEMAAVTVRRIKHFIETGE
jgi:hypothetical protein